MITLFMTGLEFYGYHGVSDEEQKIGHRYRIDIELTVDGTADRTDRVEDTVDYGEVGKLLSSVGSTTQFRTVERLASVMADRLLDSYPSISTVSIRLAKLLPPAPVIAEEAGVKLTVSRR
ncbi:MAG: dihydroneopterin aldolase [Fimbriimonas sp.]|nr:dihydroneopterin aldolase [Fimbriimonas sp.]